MAEPEETPETQMARLILALRSQGVTEPKVLSAIETTPRPLFTQDLFKERAFEDSALPIACGQTISQPFIVGLMTQALTIEPRSRVLEIGTGSGYQTLILSRLVERVWSLERIQALQSRARARLARLAAHNVRLRLTDGAHGWLEAAPFDVIVLTACASELPTTLLSQLNESGTLITPLEDSDGSQWLTRIRRHGDSYDYQRLERVRFVPLLEGVIR